MIDLNALNEITVKIKDYIKNNTSDNPRIYELWFSNMSVLKISDCSVFISVDTEIQQKSIETKYKHLVLEAIKQIYGSDIKIIAVYNTQYGKITKEQIDADEQKLIAVNEQDENNVYNSNYNNYNNEQLSLIPGNITDIEATENGTEISEFIISNTKNNGSNPSSVNVNDFKRNLRLDYTFDNFVVGSSNRLAYQACTVVAQYPAIKYNPFFIHGPSGIGKTHLLVAIAVEFAQKFKNARIIYTTSEEFTNQLVNSLAWQKNHQKPQYLQYFREKYRNCDMLLIDDIQFIAGKDATQEEFFHTFNTLYNSGKQIILTSDRPPRDIKILEDRMKSRFESGLIADIQTPDLELRIAILKRKSEAMGIKITNEVLFYLAENISSNIRQLEGAIKKLNAYSSLNDSGSGVITLEFAKACIADILSGTEPVNVTVERILSLVAQTFSVPQEDLKGRKRTKEIASARNAAIYIIRQITELSLPATAKIFDRDHSTIHHAVASIEMQIKTNNMLNNQIEEIVKLVKS